MCQILARHLTMLCKTWSWSNICCKCMLECMTGGPPARYSAYMITCASRCTGIVHDNLFVHQNCACSWGCQTSALLLLGQFVAACKGSLRRLGMEQLGIGQLHWSTANYQPLQERALWDGLLALYDQVTNCCSHILSSSGQDWSAPMAPAKRHSSLGSVFAII